MLTFWFVAAIRFSRIFFSTVKEVRLENLEIDKKSKSGVVVVRFVLKNSIWAQISGHARTIDNEIALSGNGTSLDGKALLVQGFFQRKSYSLSVFDPECCKLKPIVPRLINIQRIQTLGMETSLNTPALSIRQKVVNSKKTAIKINHSTFSNIDLL
jgi:primosomal replication protein N